MKSYAAKIEAGVVTQVFALKKGLDPKARGLVPCKKGIGPGWLYDGKRFTAPPKIIEPATADDVRYEAQRRIMVLTKTTDITAALIKQQNGANRLVRINEKRLWESLSKDEAAEIEAYYKMIDGIDAIRAASNKIDKMQPIPDDYADDKYWP